MSYANYRDYRPESASTIPKENIDVTELIDAEWDAFVESFGGESAEAKSGWPENADIPAKCIPFLDTRSASAADLDDLQVDDEAAAEIQRDAETKKQLNCGVAPECGPLHISTKTKVLFLNCEIDTLATFWNIPLIDYWRPCEGVIKKQTKISANSPEEFEDAQERLRNCGHHYTEMVIKSAAANAQSRRLKYRDDRKVTIGISKKDIMNCRGKQKKAFMNCFAIIIRIRFKGEFREVHVKVFNTGKLEIPGVPEDEMLDVVREKVVEYLQPHLGMSPLKYIRGNGDGGDEDVLINSGFHCGFCIDQKSFYAILRSEKYGIETSYDSCHYPGIRCKYYYRNGLAADDPAQNGRIETEDNGIKMSQLELSKKYTSVSFMIFSTGNCLVVGNCSKAVLMHVFEFIKRTLVAEYASICLPNESTATKIKKKKQRKKTVSMQTQYYMQDATNSR